MEHKNDQETYERAIALKLAEIYGHKTLVLSDDFFE